LKRDYIQLKTLENFQKPIIVSFQEPAEEVWAIQCTKKD